MTKNFDNWLDEGKELLIKSNKLYDVTTIETDEYERAHVKKPRGRGQWAFIFPNDISVEEIAAANKTKATINGTIREDGKLIVKLNGIGEITFTDAKKIITQIGKHLKINYIGVAP